MALHEKLRKYSQNCMKLYKTNNNCKMTFTVWDAAAIGNASLQNLTMQNAILWQILNVVNKIMCKV